MIESTPRHIFEEEVNDPTLAIGLCECPKPMNYGHVFKKSDYPDGFIRYHCRFCGIIGGVLFPPVESEE